MYIKRVCLPVYYSEDNDSKGAPEVSFRMDSLWDGPGDVYTSLEISIGSSCYGFTKEQVVGLAQDILETFPLEPKASGTLKPGECRRTEER